MDLDSGRVFSKSADQHLIKAPFPAENRTTREEYKKRKDNFPFQALNQKENLSNAGKHKSWPRK